MLSSEKVIITGLELLLCIETNFSWNSTTISL